MVIQPQLWSEHSCEWCPDSCYEWGNRSGRHREKRIFPLTSNTWWGRGKLFWAQPAYLHLNLIPLLFTAKICALVKNLSLYQEVKQKARWCSDPRCLQRSLSTSPGAVRAQGCVMSWAAGPHSRWSRGSSTGFHFAALPAMIPLKCPSVSGPCT